MPNLINEVCHQVEGSKIEDAIRFTQLGELHPYCAWNSAYKRLII